jgi:tRNA dimethylallyltransferase
VSLPYFIVVYGPTASGKTALVEELSACAPIEVINADVGQFYSKISIGTAKPDLSAQKVEHYLFDVLSEPVNYSAYEYRLRCSELIKEIACRGKIPVVVGGSGFYVKALFFPPLDGEHSVQTAKAVGDPITWERLLEIDPERARSIHPHDVYRINRAYNVWLQKGVLPSRLKPLFNPVGECRFIYVDRDKEDLVRRIAMRVEEMFKSGWVDEVRSLSPEWYQFLKVKGLMGYGDICSALEGGGVVEDVLMEIIRTKTRKYARRQRIFWRGLKKDLAENNICFDELNLTLLPLHLYIEQLSNDLSDKILQIRK